MPDYNNDTPHINITNNIILTIVSTHSNNSNNININILISLL